MMVEEPLQTSFQNFSQNDLGWLDEDLVSLLQTYLFS